MNKNIEQYFQQNLEKQYFQQFVKTHNKVDIKDVKETYKLNFSDKDLLMLSTSMYKVKDVDYIMLLYIYDLLCHHLCDCVSKKTYTNLFSFALSAHTKINEFIDTINDDDLKAKCKTVIYYVDLNLPINIHTIKL
jgi:hypothetical protein